MKKIVILAISAIFVANISAQEVKKCEGKQFNKEERVELDIKRFTNELMLKFKFLSVLGSFDFNESSKNWILYGLFAFFLYRLASSPNICADDISMLPLNNSITSSLAESRDALSMSLFCWSLITTSSITNRLRKPKLTFPTLTFVPSFFDNVFSTLFPMKC